MLFLVFILTSPLFSLGYHRFQYDRRNMDCECVPQDRCGDEDLALNGNGLLEPRIGARICPNPEEMCCETVINPDDYADVKEGAVTPSGSQCGVNKIPKFQSRITSDSTATTFGELPWNIIVQEVAEDQEPIYVCVASLIHPKAVITAAHCVATYAEEPEKLTARAGEWDTKSTSEPLPFQDRTVEEIILNPDYNPLSLRNDVAILILATQFTLGANVGLICIPTSPRTHQIVNCVTSGWGKDAYQEGKYSSIPKKVSVNIVPRDKCLQGLRATRLGRLYNLHKSFICAGGEKNRDACKGDGGGALVCHVEGDSDRLVQVGIVSWGIGCGTEGVPGVYVNVALFIDWIDMELADRDLDTSVYKL